MKLAACLNLMKSKKMNNDYTLVRHGQTYWNKNGIMHGQYDIPLNYTGVKQAKKISDELKTEFFDLCLCSPLVRAKSTAFSILQHHKNTKILYDDRLKELSKGLLEGKHLNSEKLLKNEDQNLLKKFNIESKKEFFSRVKAILRRPKKSYPQELKIGDLVLNPVVRKVFYKGKEVSLTLKEFNLLEYLMRYPNQVLSREEILFNLWGFDFDSFSNVIDVHIKNLRKKINCSRQNRLLETVRGIGYRIKGFSS